MVYGRAKVKNRGTLSAPARLFIKKLQTSPFFVKRIVYSESCFILFRYFPAVLLRGQEPSYRHRFRSSSSV